MVDTSASGPLGTKSDGFDPRGFLNRILKGDVALAVGILGILVMLILPMPSLLLDLALAISISIAVSVLMTAPVIKRPAGILRLPGGPADPPPCCGFGLNIALNPG